MGTRQCGGTTAAGQPCRRPPSRDSAYCLAHDPARVEDHAEASRAGGIARHDPEVSALKAELRDIKAAIWSGRLSPGHATALLQALRLEREHDAELSREREANAPDSLIVSIQTMRASGDVPDLSEDSEPSANDPTGGVDRYEADPYEADLAQADDPEAPQLEDYRREDGTLDGEGYLRDRHAHAAVPLSHLTIAQRRERFASNRRTSR